MIKYDILFVLTSAGQLNFHGTEQFLEGLDNNILENIQYVLCMDTLSEDNLNMHISRFPKDIEENPNKLYKIFNTTADNMQKELSYTKKKVFLTSKLVPWEHEKFSSIYLIKKKKF